VIFTVLYFVRYSDMLLVEGQQLFVIYGQRSSSGKKSEKGPRGKSANRDSPNKWPLKWKMAIVKITIIIW